MYRLATQSAVDRCPAGAGITISFHHNQPFGPDHFLPIRLAEQGNDPLYLGTP